jgi:hypothetical protein
VARPERRPPRRRQPETFADRRAQTLKISNCQPIIFS